VNAMTFDGASEVSGQLRESSPAYLHAAANSRRDGRRRVAVLSLLVLVLVSAVALVCSQRAAAGHAASMSMSADGLQSEASLLSRLQSYPGIAERTGSFLRLSTGNPVPLSLLRGLGAGGGSHGVARTADGNDDAAEQLKMMQQVTCFHVAWRNSACAVPSSSAICVCMLRAIFLL
jgi:hypothetical protein